MCNRLSDQDPKGVSWAKLLYQMLYRNFTGTAPAQLPEDWSLSEQRAVMEHFLQLYSETDMSSAQAQAVVQSALEHIIRPMLAVALDRPSSAQARTPLRTPPLSIPHPIYGIELRLALA